MLKVRFHGQMFTQLAPENRFLVEIPPNAFRNFCNPDFLPKTNGNALVIGFRQESEKVIQLLIADPSDPKAKPRCSLGANHIPAEQWPLDNLSELISLAR